MTFAEVIVLACFAGYGAIGTFVAAFLRGVFKHDGDDFGIGTVIIVVAWPAIVAGLTAVIIIGGAIHFLATYGHRAGKLVAERFAL